MLPWLSLFGFAVILATGVFLQGGVNVEQSNYLALAIASLALIHSIFIRPVEQLPREKRVPTCWILLISLVAFQMVPWPDNLVRWIAPERFHIIRDASIALGMPSFVQVSEAPGETFDHFVKLTEYASCFFLAQSLAWTFRTRLWLLATPIVIIACLESLVGISQVFLTKHSGPSGLAHGTYVNRNHFACLLEIAMPLAFVQAILLWRVEDRRTAQSIPRALIVCTLLFVAGLMWVGIVFSSSRMGFVAALASLLVAGLVAVNSRTHRGERTGGWKRWLILTTLLCACCGAALFLSPDQLRSRFVGTVKDNLSTEGRLQIWHDTMRLAGHNLATGCGLGAYEVALYPWKTAASTFRVDHAHNDYFQLFAELGIPGALILLTLAGAIIYRLFRFAFTHNNSQNWGFALCLCGSFTAMALHSITDFNLYIPANALAFAWLAGIAGSPVFARVRRTSGHEQGSRRRDERGRRKGIRIMPFAWPLLGLTCSALAVWIDSNATAGAWYCRVGLCRAEDLRPRRQVALGQYEVAYRAMAWEEAANPYRWIELAELEDLAGNQFEAQAAWARVLTLGAGSAPVLMRAVNADAVRDDKESVMATAFKILQVTDDYDPPIFDYLHNFFKLPVAQILGQALPPRCGALQRWVDWICDNGTVDEASESWHWAFEHACADDRIAGRYAWAMVRHKAYQQASNEWTEYMEVVHKRERPPGEFLWNESFAHTPLMTPFDWTFETLAGVDLIMQEGLEVRFPGGENLDFHHIHQLVYVKHGVYALEVDASAAGLTTNEGPRFYVHDVDKPQRWGVEGEMYRGDVPRGIRITKMQVPSSTRSIVVELIRRPSLKLDSKIKGTLRIYSVRLLAQ